jgi:hypothetical protein
VTIDMLSARGHVVNYLRRPESQGVTAARHDLLQHILSDFDRILLPDDGMVLLPDTIHEMFQIAMIPASWASYRELSWTRIHSLLEFTNRFRAAMLGSSNTNGAAFSAGET